MALGDGMRATIGMGKERLQYTYSIRQYYTIANTNNIGRHKKECRHQVPYMPDYRKAAIDSTPEGQQQPWRWAMQMRAMSENGWK